MPDSEPMPEPGGHMPYVNKKSTPVIRAPRARITGDQYLAARTHTVCPACASACAGVAAKTKLVAVSAPIARQEGDRCFRCGNPLTQEAASYHTQADIDYAARLPR